jgi:putative phosphoesterase
MNLARRREAVPVVGGALKLVVVADSHSRPHPRTLELVEAQKPDRIVHAGDVGDLGVLDALAKVAPMLAVRGNIDVHAPEVPDILTLDLEEAGASYVTVLVTHIAVNGPRLRADAVRLAHAEGAQLVICGHSHVPFIGRDKGFSIFNPGSIGPRRFQLPIVFGVLELKDARLTMKHINCETGEDWRP